MTKVEAQLGRLDEFLASAQRDWRARAQIASMLRDHARQVLDDRVQTGYSFELAEADISLITAISAYECDESQEKLHALRQCLSQFHLAARSAAGPMSMTYGAPSSAPFAY